MLQNKKFGSLPIASSVEEDHNFRKIAHVITAVLILNPRSEINGHQSTEICSEILFLGVTLLKEYGFTVPRNWLC